MSQVFADTGYWIALLNPRDELHERAREVSATLELDQIVTSEWVLTELLNSFAERGTQLRACGLLFSWPYTCGQLFAS
jgi:predicted nucleic acid-binding protein